METNAANLVLTFPVGSTWVIRGLKSAKELNGQTATVCGHKHAHHTPPRITIKVPGRKKKFGVKVDSLVPDCVPLVEGKGKLEMPACVPHVIGKGKLEAIYGVEDIRDLSLKDRFLMHACYFCGANRSVGTSNQTVKERAVKKCKGCSAAWYCCPEHQKLDWPNHKSDCNSLKKLRRQMKKDAAAVGPMNNQRCNALFDEAQRLVGRDSVDFKRRCQARAMLLEIVDWAPHLDALGCGAIRFQGVFEFTLQRYVASFIDVHATSNPQKCRQVVKIESQRSQAYWQYAHPGDGTVSYMDVHVQVWHARIEMESMGQGPMSQPTEPTGQAILKQVVKHYMEARRLRAVIEERARILGEEKMFQALQGNWWCGVLSSLSQVLTLLNQHGTASNIFDELSQRLEQMNDLGPLRSSLGRRIQLLASSVLLPKHKEVVEVSRRCAHSHKVTDLRTLPRAKWEELSRLTKPLQNDILTLQVTLGDNATKLLAMSRQAKDRESWSVAVVGLAQVSLGQGDKTKARRLARALLSAHTCSEKKCLDCLMAKEVLKTDFYAYLNFDFGEASFQAPPCRKVEIDETLVI